MPPIRQVSAEQLELLVEFAESKKNVGIQGPLGHQESARAWNELAKKLNSIGEGTTKSPIKWKRYWHLLKCRTKTKAADVRRDQNGTEDGSYRIAPLSELEQRIVWVIGDIAKRPVKESPKVQRPRVRPIVPMRPPKGIPSTPNGDGHDVPRWLCDLEERRITAEEKLAEAAVSLSVTNKEILSSLKQMADTQAQLVNLLQERLNPPSNL